ncbi:ribosome-binding factor A [Staphylococcus epidermidis ATCC 12228]|uniref:Ribosome-binding factor A n=1 Tax=Staphylococcus epidermidis (strain ATCC 12228 / FDA PCI 1200) TaxID=176280 RepID=A0A0H2VG01_STAES|nr:ribosome-binding factor A [Staphylococcus epidermidis ATCC 12228]
MRSILLPYSIDSSYSNVNSGIILRRIREPSSDFINPVALCKALNVLSTSLSFPNTVKYTFACERSLVSSTSVIVKKPTLGSLTLLLTMSMISCFICSPTRSALILFIISPLFIFTLLTNKCEISDLMINY